MVDSRYTYDKINAIKVIVVNKKDEILLIQEPETNEWMPLHWGLPGGKPVVKESLIDAYRRKMQEELGSVLQPDGLFRIEEMLQDNRTILMYIFVAHVEEQIKPQGESKAYKWAGLNEIKQMKVDDFTEFFNKKLLSDFLTGERDLVPLSIIESWPYFTFKNNKEYQEWLRSGTSERHKF